MKVVKNKEYGSDFHFNSDPKWNLNGVSHSIFNEEEFSFFFSGRVALHSLLKQGIKENGWQEVFFPSFYCHEVVEFIKNLNIKISYYNFNPFLDSNEIELEIDDSPSNVIINVNFFGLKKINLEGYKHSIIIDDVTHSILDFEKSNATYCFGSLRKELPVPTGGFCYSPKKNKLPKGKQDFDCDAISIQKKAAMILKSDYLLGISKEKESFRSLFTTAELHFTSSTSNAKMEETARELLFELDVKTIITAKKHNLKKAQSLYKFNENCQINLSSSSHGFGLVLNLNSKEDKLELLNYLITYSIYPATLWPHQKTFRDISIENKILFIPMDYRYSSNDVIYITEILNNFFQTK